MVRKNISELQSEGEFNYRKSATVEGVNCDRPTRVGLFKKAPCGGAVYNTEGKGEDVFYSGSHRRGYRVRCFVCGSTYMIPVEAGKLTYRE